MTCAGREYSQSGLDQEDDSIFVLCLKFRFSCAFGTLAGIPVQEGCLKRYFFFFFPSWKPLHLGK